MVYCRPIGARQQVSTDFAETHPALRTAGAAMSTECTRATFDLATALVFASVDPATGLQTYRELGGAGDTDSMVAAGVCLIEGLGVPRNNEEGLQWLHRACDLGSAQGQFELGTLVYTGSADLEEDEVAAFELFHKAANQEHASGMFMVADCLLEGIGCEQDQGKAVPLLLAAANLGHRGARQHLRQLLDGNWQGFTPPNRVAWRGEDLPSAKQK